MRIGAAYIDGQRHAASVGQHGSLDAKFSSICRVFPGFFPHPVATWSSPRPCFATPTGFLLAHRIPAMLSSTVCGRFPTWSTPESSCAAYCPSHIHAEPLSIGSRYAKYRRCHLRFAVAANAVARLYGLRDISATMEPSAPTTRPEDAKHKKYVPSSSFSPPCKAWINQSVSSIRREVGKCSVFG